MGQVTDLGFDKPFTPRPDTEYERQARAFLEKHAIVFHAQLMGTKCPIFCNEGETVDRVTGMRTKYTPHNHGDHYRVMFKRMPKGKSWSFDFWGSIVDQQAGYAPTPYDVLACITKSDPGPFEDFCADFGYSTDSRQAERTYKEVSKEWRKAKTFFTTPEIFELQDIQ